MADPRTAADNQLRNVEARTGKTFAQLRKLIADLIEVLDGEGVS